MNNNIGDFIKELRKEKNLTQKELGSLLDIDDRTISKWERGVYLPDITILISLSKALGVTVDELLEGKRHEKIIPPEPISIPKPEPVVTPPKVTKEKSPKLITIPKYLFTIIILIIVIISSISVFTITKSLDDSSSPNNQIATSDVNVYKIVSDDKNLNIDGFLIEKGTNKYLIIKRISFLNVENDFVNNSNKIKLYINFPNKDILLYEKIKDSKILTEYNTINIDKIDSQQIFKIDKINFNKLELKLVNSENENNKKEITYQIKLVKTF